MAEQNNSLPSSAINQIVFPVSFAIMSIITTIGNLLVIAAVYKNLHKELRTVSNYLVVNLAVADLIVGLILEPIIISLHWTHDLKLSIAAFLLSQFAVTASSVTILFLTIERYIVLEMPMPRKKLFSGVAVKIYICLIWFCALILSLLHIPFRELRSYSFFLVTAGEVQLLFMLGLYVRMFVIIRNFNKAILAQGAQQPLIQPGPAYITARTREHKFAKAIFLFVGTFALCCLPWNVTQTVRMWRSWPIDITDNVSQCFILLLYLNSALNPILYTLIMPSFRQTVKKIFYDFKLRCTQIF